MILIKLGGSIITNKNKPLTPQKDTINQISKKLAKINEPLIIVHGGGSYGHYWSTKYDMHTKPANYNIHGVSIVKNSMITLNKIILDTLTKNKLSPYAIPPTDFMNTNKPIPKKIQNIKQIAKSKLIPTTYGDALWYNQKKSYILSGDKIMTMLAKAIKPRLTIFVLDVDGVYQNMHSKKLVKQITAQNKIEITAVKKDVTGGMSRKMQEAANISKAGLKVFFVNGYKPQRIVNAIHKNEFIGTIFTGERKR